MLDILCETRIFFLQNLLMNDRCAGGIKIFFKKKKRQTKPHKKEIRCKLKIPKWIFPTYLLFHYLYRCYVDTRKKILLCVY